MVIGPENAGRRLDRFLLAFLNGASKSFVYKMLRKKRIKLNTSRAHGSEMLNEGDVLRFYLSQSTIDGFRRQVVAEEARPMPEIVHEDDSLLVVNKPAGLASQGGIGSGGDHLIGRILFYLQQKGEFPPDADFTPGICNRLDINTSGLLICGKNLRSLQEYGQLFRDRAIRKEYIAVVDGIISSGAIFCDFISKDEKARKAVILNDIGKDHNGKTNSLVKQTITKTTVLAHGPAQTCLLVEPITGRFHQIRAQLSHHGQPLAGDKKYGGKPFTFARNQLLHCWRISVNSKGLVWEAPLPQNFSDCIKGWRATCEIGQRICNFRMTTW